MSKTAEIPASHLAYLCAIWLEGGAYFDVQVGTCKASGEWIQFQSDGYSASAMRVRASAITAYEMR